VLLVAVTFFANVMLHAVENRIWGLHWLSTYWPTFLLIFVALLLSSSAAAGAGDTSAASRVASAVRGRDLVTPLVAAATVCLVVTASRYNFTYVNSVFKQYFCYRSVSFPAVLVHKLNRFEVPLPDSRQLYQRTLSIYRGHQHAVRLIAIPTELYYLGHDLRLFEPGVTHSRNGTPFEGSLRTFDMSSETPNGPFVVSPSKWARHIVR
jgi:hypothetical protein